MKSVTIAAANSSFAELVRGAEKGEAVTITRRGQPVAVVLSTAEFQRLQTAAAGAVDFPAWLAGWRSRLPAGFDGITQAELDRWLQA